jgi:hypothetical protein
MGWLLGVDQSRVRVKHSRSHRCQCHSWEWSRAEHMSWLLVVEQSTFVQFAEAHRSERERESNLASIPGFWEKRLRETIKGINVYLPDT